MSHDERCIAPLVFPAAIANRPALPRIGYRIGTYADVREALLRWRDTTPELVAWTHRGADDPGVALLEGSALLVDILAFYQELYANECFLRTATWRDSVAELVRLTGYRLAPAIGGTATLAARVLGDTPVTLPAGLAVTAPLESGPTATLETTEELVAEPWLSEVPIYGVGSPPPLWRTTATVAIDGEIELRVGDRLLVAEWLVPDTLLQSPAIVVAAEVRRSLGRTIVAIRGQLNLQFETQQLVAFRLGRSHRHFGHNAPPHWSNADGVQDTEFERAFADATAPSIDRLGSTEIPLDSNVEIATGSTVVCSAWVTGNLYTLHARSVISAVTRSLTWGPMTAAVTVLGLDREVEPIEGYTHYDIRAFDIHEVRGGPWTVTAAPTPSATALHCYATAAEAALLADRRLLCVVPDAAEPVEVRVVLDDAADPYTRRLRAVTVTGEVDLPAAATWDAPVARLHGNVVDATEGATQREVVLGNGDARRSWQSFRLPKAPLTYLRDAATGRAPELTLYVDGRAWRRVETLVDAGPTDEVYVVREDARGDSHVTAGDGTTGRRFPSGVGNVAARYRAGAGSHGPLRAGGAARSTKRIAGLDRFELPGVVAGGDPPESAEVARRAAPARLQSLGRLVSLADYEAEALALPGVEEAAARWDEADGVASIVVTVLMTHGRAAELAAVTAALRAADRCRGPRRHPIVVRAGAAEYVYLHLAVARDGAAREDDVRTAVAAALGVGGTTGGLFGTDGRRLGAPEYATRVLGVVQNVAGVRWASVTAFGSLGVADRVDELALPAAPTAAGAIACAPDRCLRLHTSDAVAAFAITFTDGAAGGECAS
jgi:predicted phage baseplate assembly protein